MATEHQTGTEAPGVDAAFPPFDPGTFSSTIFWLIVSFSALYLIMSKYALPRVHSILAARSAKIHESLAAARKMRKEAEEASAAYERTLAEARGNAQTLANAARDKAKAEQEAKRRTIESDLDQKLRSAEVQIAEMKAGVMANVDQIAREAATAIVTQLTGKAPDAKAIAAALVLDPAERAGSPSRAS